MSLHGVTRENPNSPGAYEMYDFIIMQNTPAVNASPGPQVGENQKAGQQPEWAGTARRCPTLLGGQPLKNNVAVSVTCTVPQPGSWRFHCGVYLGDM